MKKKYYIYSVETGVLAPAYKSFNNDGYETIGEAESAIESAMETDTYKIVRFILEGWSKE